MLLYEFYIRARKMGYTPVAALETAKCWIACEFSPAPERALMAFYH